ncbi:MAG TPA: CAP domain-containing protein [Polyangiales bacterium]|nr:CAP domain-containing protein [Polyangiales bacterium]
MRRIAPCVLLVWLLPLAAAAEPECTPDVALGDAAAELLLAGKAPDPQQLMAAVRGAGSDAVAVRALYLPDDDPARLAGWLAELRKKTDAPLICGDARAARGRLIVASARGGTFWLERGRLRGTLAPGFDRPELIVRHADGSSERASLSLAELERGIPLEPSWRSGKLQLMAHGPSGPRPVAERSTAGAELQPAAAELQISGALDARGVFEALAQLREQHAKPALRGNRLAQRVATKYAADVCAQGRVVHELEPGVTPETRVARAGLKAKLVGETVARAADAAAALKALWQSPSHAMTLLEPRFTDVGVGLASDDHRRTCLVVLLLSWPRPVAVSGTD